MIDKDDILRASNNGLDIILAYYPQAAECVGTNKKFKLRNSERTPSASIRLYGNQYKVTDFGGDGTALSPFDICMAEENCSFNEAICLLADRLGVSTEISISVNKPDIRKRAANPEENEGEKFFQLRDSFTPEECRIMGPLVKPEDLTRYGWHVADWVAYVKNREVTTKHSTDTYPIFVRQCPIEPNPEDPSQVLSFYKVYEPLNPDKGFRFSYIPSGAKPKDYIAGLWELQVAFRQFNKKEEDRFYSEPENREKSFKEQKLPEAFLCSGERDAMCCASMGFNPLWLNSETGLLTDAMYNTIMKYVDVLYVIPDIDVTGRLAGTKLALKYIDIHTVWLPKQLSTFKDNRGNPRKDLRDFCDIFPYKNAFRNLIKLAMPARFWKFTTDMKTGASKCEIDSECLFYFLKLNGFHRLKDENSPDSILIRLESNRVRKVTPDDIKDFLIQYAYENALDRNIRNIIRNSTRMNKSVLNDVEPIELDFADHTASTQVFFFENATVEVTPSGIIKQGGRLSDSRHIVWETKIIKQQFKLLENMFEITPDGHGEWDIQIGEHQSNLFRYLINTSRLYWRKELEYQFEEDSELDKSAYIEANRFTIDGPALSPEEITEQKLNLVNKIFAIGYMLHRYKAASRAWAPFAMDDKVGENNQCNGRSGKSFIFKVLSLFKNTVKLSGRNPKLMENPFVFEQVNRHTDMVLFDDCDRYFTVSQLYDNITSDMTINPKHNSSFTIPFTKSPKMAFTTNYVPNEFNASSEARLLYMVFSDYYHEHTPENDYIETRSIRDDFNKDLYDSFYSAEEWNQDINFLLQCCRFYLSTISQNVKIQPPLTNILKRKSKQDMGDSGFEDWAEVYFHPESGHLDAYVQKDQAFFDYKNSSSNNRWTPQKFKRALVAYCSMKGYMFNPVDLQDKNGRIIQRTDIGTKEMIYIRTISNTDSDHLEATQGQLAF